MFLTSNPFKTMYTNGCFQLHISWCTPPQLYSENLGGNFIRSCSTQVWKMGSIHSRDEARTTNTPKKWDVSWTSSSAANRAREHDLHTNLAQTWLTVNHPNVLRLCHPFCCFFFSRRPRFATSQRNQYSTFYYSPQSRLHCIKYFSCHTLGISI